MAKTDKITDKNFFVFRFSIPILILIAVAVYANALANGFVFSDGSQVLNNAWLRDPSSIWKIITSPVWAFKEELAGVSNFTSNYYRPVMHLIFLAVYQVAGPAAWAFHSVNVALHAVNTALVYVVVKAALERGFNYEVEQSERTAFAASLVFGVHASHVEAVAWISALPELSFTLFALLSFLLYIKGDGASLSNGAASAVLFALALLSKETAVVLPVILVAYDIAAFGRFKLRRYIPFALIAAGYMLLRVAILGSMVPSKASEHGDIIYVAVNAAMILGEYLRLLAWPTGLSTAHHFEPLTVVFSSAFALTATYLAAFVLIIFFVRKDRAALFFVVLGVVALLPAIFLTLKVHGFRGWSEGFAERYLYLPSIGFSVFAVVAASHLFNHIGTRIGERRGTAISWAAVTIAVLGLSVATVKRNAVWRDNYTLWKDAVEHGEPSPREYGRFADAAFKAGLPEEAARAYGEALKKWPDSVLVNAEYAGFLFKTNEMEEAAAARHYKLAISRVKSGNADLLHGLNRSLGDVYLASGKLSDSAKAYEEALVVKPKSAAVWNQLGIVRAEQGDLAGAIECFEKAVSISPNDEDAKANLERARGIVRP